MLKVLPIVICLFAFACKADNRKEEHKTAFDEAALKDFVLATVAMEEIKSLEMIDSIVAGSAKDSVVFSKTIGYLEKPFGDPNSVYRNENFYAGLLQAKLKSGWIDSATKASTREKLYLLMQNRPGSLANDFTYVTPAGYNKKMYDVKVEYTLLYFNNPDCDACKQMREALTGSEMISQKIKSGELKILSIYTDQDEKRWLDHLAEFPQQWIQGRDDDDFLYKNKVYDLRAIPTIYLLDKDKKVVLKDCLDVKEIEEVIRNS